MRIEVPDDFLRDMQRYVARTAVTASAARGQGAPGLVESARGFLGSMSLGPFGTRSEKTFRAALNRQTTRMVEVLPPQGRSWGIARKLLNIFLRNALYTTYLRDRYHLAEAERWFEVPMDAIVARRIRAEMPDVALPRWSGVKHLTPDLNQQYQIVCNQLGRRRGLRAVHLDAVFWGGREAMS